MQGCRRGDGSQARSRRGRATTQAGKQRHGWMREYSIGLPQDLEPVLTAGHTARLAAIGRRRCLTRGEIVYRQGEAAAHVFLLAAGTAQSFLINSAGQESLLRIHLPGSILGLTALATVPWRDASARAVADVELVAIERDRLQELLRSEPELSLRVIRLLVDRMRDFHFRVGELQALSVEQRLARVLLAVSRQDGPPDLRASRSVGLTHQELAHLVNASRQTVSTTLSRFAELGHVARRGRSTVLVDIAGLAALLPEGPQPRQSGVLD